MVVRLLLRRMKEEDERAISEPEDSAMETSAVCSAGVSFVPSPVKAIMRRFGGAELFVSVCWVGDWRDWM